MKLSIAQSTMLRVIATAGTHNGEQLAWYARCSVYVENRELSFSADTAGPALRALYRKGLAKPYPRLGQYSSIITSEGLKQAEQEKGKPLCFISPFDQQILKEKTRCDHDQRDNAKNDKRLHT